MEYYKISKELMRSEMIPSHKLVLAVLTDHAQKAQQVAIIDDAFLARETGLSVPNVKKIMKKLNSRNMQMQNKINQPRLQIFEMFQYPEILVFYRICASEGLTKTEDLKNDFYFLDAEYLESLLQKMREMKLIQAAQGMSRTWVCPEQGPQHIETVTHWRVTEKGRKLVS